MSIHWLPPELLSQIFAALVLDVDFGDASSPVVVSHVCAQWRALVLSAPKLWSRIVIRGSNNVAAIPEFLSRSKDSNLVIDYASSPNCLPTEDNEQVLLFTSMVCPYFHRCEELSFQSSTAKALGYLVFFLKDDFTKVFPILRRLNLSISTPNPSFMEAPSLLQRQDPIKLFDEPSPPRLQRLALNQVPSCNLPAEFISNLRRLELSYSPRKHRLSRHDYLLKLSTLCGFLALTPLLEELILTNTVPFLDALPAPIAPTTDSNPTPTSYLRPVRLTHLKTIEWTYPSTNDIPRVLGLLDAPALDRLDLWVENPPFKRPQHQSSSHECYYTQGIPSFPALRDLSLQCNGDENMVCALRKFSFPAIERLAFTNVDPVVREPVTKEDPLPFLVVFPRLESIFHDPRLPHLTHLTLSHFEISPESGKGETVFGYMPVLTSLSLDSCIGVGKLLESLQEQLVGGMHPRRGVKLCPRLEALSIWGCQDVEFNCLRQVILARNGTTTKDSIIAQEDDTAKSGLANGPNTGTQVGCPSPSILLWTERKIKPLKPSHSSSCSFKVSPSSSSSDPKTKVLSTLIAMREVLEPARIIYARIMDCKLVSEEQAWSLRDLGVVDVIWASSSSSD